MGTITQLPERMFIGGTWAESASDEWMDVINPSTEQVVGTLPIANELDVNRAVHAAREAAASWGATPIKERAEAVRSVAKVLLDNADDLAELETLDSGNPITAMKRDAKGGAAAAEYFANLATELKGTQFPLDEETLIYTRREPYGVVGRMIPFNHPLRFAAANAAVALVAGNTMVMKPSEHTSLTALALAELAADVLPAGVWNVVTGRAATGEAIVRHPDVPRIAATGGVPTGRAILAEAAHHVKHVSLELGGKNPMIVFPDVEPAAAAKGAALGMNLSSTMGQSCQSNSRVFVHSDIAEEFTEALRAEFEALTVGDPKDPSTDMGPLAFEAHHRRVLDYIEMGRTSGQLVTGGVRPLGLDQGYYVTPTIFTKVDVRERIAREEIFGPVVVIIEWSDLDDVIAAANSVEYGLTAKVWTNDITLAHRTAHRLDAGYVWINGRGGRPQGTPFGGFKHSGLGKGGDLSELLSYTREKTINTTLQHI